MSKFDATILLGFVAVLCAVSNSNGGESAAEANNANDTPDDGNQVPVDWKTEIMTLCNVMGDVTGVNKNSELEDCIKNDPSPKGMHTCLYEMVDKYYYKIILEASFYINDTEKRHKLRKVNSKYIFNLLLEKVPTDESPEFQILDDIANDYDREHKKTLAPSPPPDLEQEAQ